MPTPDVFRTEGKPVVERYADDVAELVMERERLYESLVRTQTALRAARHRLDELLAHVALAHATFRQDSER